ncbi:MAG: TlpA disulfide reductase family protein [Pseudomonadota bacterium]
MTGTLAKAMYLGVALLASGAMLGPAQAADLSEADIAALKDLRTGDMKKLLFASEPTPLPRMDIVDAAGASTSLDAYKGEWLVLNFWATWCAPCRVEMPMLSNLQTHFKDEPVRVVTVATGRNSPQGIKRFFDEIEVDNLPEYRDPTQALARAMSILGLPITVIIDPEGREIARLRGDAHWDSPSAIAILNALSSGS